jgi:hypothetical protein
MAYKEGAPSDLETSAAMLIRDSFAELSSSVGDGSAHPFADAETSEVADAARNGAAAISHFKKILGELTSGRLRP